MIAVKNFGATPAYDGWMTTSGDCVDGAGTTLFEIPHDQSTLGDLPPGDRYGYQHGFDATPEEAHELFEQNAKLRLSVELSYTDTFGHKRSTKFDMTTASGLKPGNLLMRDNPIIST